MLLLAVTTTASAHSELAKTEPEVGASLENSPAEVIAWFSEELDSQSSSMRVFDSQNNQVDNGDGGVDLNDLDHLTMIVSLSPLQAGTYFVHWESVSAEDGDSEEGEFIFSVTKGTGPTEVSNPSAGISTTWLVSDAVAILVIAVVAMIGVSRRKRSSQ